MKSKAIKFEGIRALLSQNYTVYLAGFLTIFGLKYFYSRAGSSDLNWILAPTAWWVTILGGVPFEQEIDVGYVSHAYRFIIAPSCSGVQFMIITIAMLVFSFIHRMRTRGRKLLWTVFSFGFSYVYTVFVNGIRIAVSIFLPVYLENSLSNQRLTPERLHTLTGITIYFAALLMIYGATEAASRKVCGIEKENAGRCLFAPFVPGALHTVFHRYGAPVFWYFTIVLGIPLITRIYRNEWGGFREFTALTAAMCLAVLLPFCLISLIKKDWKDRKMNRE